MQANAAHQQLHLQAGQQQRGHDGQQKQPRHKGNPPQLYLFHSIGSSSNPQYHQKY